MAAIGALISMLSFVLLALLAESYGPALHKVVVIDCIALVALGLALILRALGW